MSINLTDKALETLHASGEGVVITLRDGGSLSGRIIDFDGYTLMLSGSPDFMVYRHSILKLVPASVTAAAAPQKAQRPAADRQPRPVSQRKPLPSKPRKPAPARREPAVQPQPATGDTGFANPLADQMQKWLKNQKGGG